MEESNNVGVIIVSNVNSVVKNVTFCMYQSLSVAYSVSINEILLFSVLLFFSIPGNEPTGPFNGPFSSTNHSEFMLPPAASLMLLPSHRNEFSVARFLELLLVCSYTLLCPIVMSQQKDLTMTAALRRRNRMNVTDYITQEEETKGLEFEN